MAVVVPANKQNHVVHPLGEFDGGNHPVAVPCHGIERSARPRRAVGPGIDIIDAHCSAQGPVGNQDGLERRDLAG